jgi:DnaJ family protein A protein 2
MYSNQELVVKNYKNDRRGYPRDLVFKLKENKHSVFTRKNADLMMNVKLTLSQALFGFTIPIKHLDGKEIWIKSKPNEIVNFNQILMVSGQGMPVFNQPGVRGRLFVRVEIEMPKKLDLDSESLQKLEKLLSLSSETSYNHKKPKQGQQIVQLIKTDIASFGSFGNHRASQSYEDDDDVFSSFSFFR